MSDDQEARERVRTAYHEAGHIVVGAVLGFHLRLATIAPIEGFSQGLAVISRMSRRAGALLASNPDAAHRMADREEIIKLYAGPIAENMYAESVDDDFLDEIAASGDIDTIEDIIEARYSNTRRRRQALMNRYRGRAYRRAVQILTQHWRAVDAVARALLLHTTLNGEQLRAIIDQAQQTSTAD